MIQMQLQLPLLLFQHMMIPFLRTFGVDEMNLRCCIRGAVRGACSRFGRGDEARRRRFICLILCIALHGGD